VFRTSPQCQSFFERKWRRKNPKRMVLEEDVVVAKEEVKDEIMSILIIMKENPLEIMEEKKGRIILVEKMKVDMINLMLNVITP